MIDVRSIIAGIIGILIGLMSGYLVRMYFSPCINKPIFIQNGITTNELELRNRMRTLWEDHINWTRSCLLQSEETAYEQRLLKNKEDLSVVFKEYYGPEVAEQLHVLLKEQVNILSELIKQVKAGSTFRAWNYDAKLTRNMHDLADLLMSINPRMQENKIKKLLLSHLDLVKKEARARASGNSEEVVQLCDKVHTQILELADALSTSIVQQFQEFFVSAQPVDTTINNAPIKPSQTESDTPSKP